MIRTREIGVIGLWVLVGATMLALLAGCGGGGGGGTAPPQQTGTVRGQVTDGQTGQPVAGATVTASVRKRWSQLPSRRTTDAQGRFEITGLPIGSEVTIHVERDGYQTTDVNTTVASQTPVDLTIRFYPTGTAINSIHIEPRNQTVWIARTLNFVAQTDPPGLQPTWSVIGPVGSISANGVFQSPDPGQVKVQARISTVFDETTVTVVQPDFFPLGSSDVWNYWDPNDHNKTRTVTVVPGEAIDGVQTTAWHQVWDTKQGDYYFSKQPTQLLLYGARTPEGGTTYYITFSPPIQFLMPPWTGTIGPSAHTASISVSGIPVAQQQWTVTVTVQTVPDVSVPAGTFHDVYQVTAVMVRPDRTMTSQWWFAPDVGRIKAHETEENTGIIEYWFDLTSATVGGVNYP